jgi:hypothetical protein
LRVYGYDGTGKVYAYDGAGRREGAAHLMVTEVECHRFGLN